MFPFSSIKAYHAALEHGQVTCVDAVRFYIGQIRQHRHLNAYVHIFEPQALARAQSLDAKKAAGSPTGKLFGVVVAIKDVISIQGQPVSAASRILEGFQAIYNATVIDHLLQEDAILIGTTN